MIRSLHYGQCFLQSKSLFVDTVADVVLLLHIPSGHYILRLENAPSAFLLIRGVEWTDTESSQRTLIMTHGEDVLFNPSFPSRL